MVPRWLEPFVTGAGFEPFIYSVRQRARQLNAGYGGIRDGFSLSSRAMPAGRGAEGGAGGSTEEWGQGRKRVSLRGNRQQQMLREGLGRCGHWRSWRPAGDLGLDRAEEIKARGSEKWATSPRRDQTPCDLLRGCVETGHRGQKGWQEFIGLFFPKTGKRAREPPQVELLLTNKTTQFGQAHS